MKKYIKPSIETEEIFSEDVILSSGGYSLPEEPIGDQTGGQELPEQQIEP